MTLQEPRSQASEITQLYPPFVEAPEKPLGTLRFLIEVVRNPLLSLPATVYRQPYVVHRPSRHMTVMWICDPPVIEDILVDKKGQYRKNIFEERLLKPILGNGVLIAEGQNWRWQRRAMAPLFHSRDIMTYVPTMAAAAEEQIARWRADGPDGIRQVDAAMVDTTFSIITRTMLVGGDLAESESIKHAGEAYLARISWELAYTLLGFPKWVPHPAKWQMYRSARQLRTAVDAIMRRRRADADGGDDLLGRLINATDPETGQRMSDELIVDNLLTLLSAGHETTARALVWSLYLLARAPDWQQRARDEIERVSGGGPIGAKEVGELAVTERILKEAMRLYSPVSVIARTPRVPMSLFGYNIKPGDQLIIPLYALHRHEQHWDAPARFDPDRFLPEHERDRPRTVFMPFGGGARICLGMSFAMVEAKAVLATLLRHAAFEWDGAYLPEPVSRVTLRPRHGMPLKVRMLD